MARVLVHYDLPPEFAAKFRECITGESFKYRFERETNSVYSTIVNGWPDTYDELERLIREAAKGAPQDSLIFLERPAPGAGPSNSHDIVQIAIHRTRAKP